VYVEVTSAIESSEARADNKVADLSFGLSRWALSDEAAAGNLSGHSLTFLMPTPPSRREERLAFAELKRFVSTEAFHGLSATRVQDINDKYPVLHSLGVKFYCAAGPVTTVQVKRGAMSVEAPWSAARVIGDAINRKTKKAHSWPHPLWLAVWIIGHYYNPDAMIKAIMDDGAMPFQTFDLVYIGGAKSILLIYVCA
jgi:hypothetical protein